MQVIGTIFTKPGQFGDFNWMIGNKDYDDSLFIFNDNEEHHETCRQGAGNAIIRKFNKYSNLDVPRSIGIPTGTLNIGGYTTFDLETRNKIDNYFKELEELVEKYKYTRIYYSAESNGLVGTSIFKVNHKVLEYITWKIHLLSENPIQIIRCIKPLNEQIDESYFANYNTESEDDDNDIESESEDDI